MILSATLGGVVTARFMEATPAELIRPDILLPLRFNAWATFLTSSCEETSQVIDSNGTFEMSRERPKISTPTDNSLSQIALPSPLLAPVTIIISCRPFATEIPLPASQQSETCFATSTSPFPKSSQTQSPASPQYLQATSKAPTISSSPRRDRRQSTEYPQTRASCFQAAR